MYPLQVFFEKKCVPPPFPENTPRGQSSKTQTEIPAAEILPTHRPWLQPPPPPSGNLTRTGAQSLKFYRLRQMLNWSR